MHGISDALRDAEYLSRALDAGLRGEQRMPEALAEYERVRDEQSVPMLAALAALPEPPRHQLGRFALAPSRFR